MTPDDIKLKAGHIRATITLRVSDMKSYILAAVRDCKYCPSAALSNLAFYAAKRGEITLDDASVLFDEWSAETLYPPDKRELIINQIKMAILQATPIGGQHDDNLCREEEKLAE